MIALTLLYISLVVAVPTNVILTFDDGLSDHHSLSQMLDLYGVKGTFYINSGRLNAVGYLSLTQLYSISDRGHEIGGHGLNHLDLLNQTLSVQYSQICDDRNSLLAYGLNVTSFAYPFGASSFDTFGVVADCGYNSARDSGGIKTPTSCLNCPTTESSPPVNPFQIRSMSYRSSMGLQGLKDFVLQSLNRPISLQPNGGLVFIFHEYGNYPLLPTAILPSDLSAFVSWLKNTSDITIKTVNSFIGGSLQPLYNRNNSNTNIGVPHVALTFDYGTLDHFDVSKTLESQSMRGVFFVNSGTINTPGYLTNTQLRIISDSGHEIGGRTRTGPHLFQLSTPQLTSEICDDRTTISSWISPLNVTSISWPYGETNSTIQQLAKGCGYIRGRDIGGLKVQGSCGLCPTSIDLPTTTPLVIRSFVVKSFHTLGDLMWQVLSAEQSYSTTRPPSLLVYSFERVCTGCAFSPLDFQYFIRWLKPRQNRGTKVSLLRDIVV